jgi:hypothetical protein
MKYFSRSLYSVILFSFCLSLAACKTVRTSDKAVSESETAAVTASRLTFYRTIDSLSRQFNMAADSIIMIFPNTSMTEFPTAFPSGIEGCAETPSDSLAILKKHNAHKRLRNASRSATASRHSQVPSYLLRPPGPVALKIYGLHIAENSEEKTVAKADLKDSVSTVTQSRKNKSATKQSSKPSSTPKYIFLILVLVFVLYIIYRLR